MRAADDTPAGRGNIFDLMVMPNASGHWLFRHRSLKPRCDATSSPSIGKVHPMREFSLQGKVNLIGCIWTSSCGASPPRYLAPCRAARGFFAKIRRHPGLRFADCAAAPDAPMPLPGLLVLRVLPPPSGSGGESRFFLGSRKGAPRLRPRSRTSRIGHRKRARPACCDRRRGTHRSRRRYRRIGTAPNGRGHEGLPPDRRSSRVSASGA